VFYLCGRHRLLNFVLHFLSFPLVVHTFHIGLVSVSNGGNLRSSFSMLLFTYNIQEDKGVMGFDLYHTNPIFIIYLRF